MYDITIIGAGPSGSSAAIFTAKAGKKTLVIDSDKSLTKKAWVKNHYGLEETKGPDLLDFGKRQASKFGAEIIQNTVQDITKVDNGFRIETEDQIYETKHVIFATGVLVDLAEKVGLHIKPGTEPWIEKVLDVDANGKTNIEGIWAAGTVAGVSVHTIITAGDGAKVAINVLSQLNGKRYVDHD